MTPESVFMIQLANLNVTKVTFQNETLIAYNLNLVNRKYTGQ